MSSANVRAIHALDDFKAALARFGSEAQDALGAAAQEIQRTLDWLAERANHWRNEVRRRAEAVRQAEAALARCQACRPPRDCSAYQNALLQARVRLREAEAELKNVQQWTQLVQHAVAEYQREAQRLAAVLSADLPKASALLGNSADILQSYAAMGAPSVGIPSDFTAATQTGIGAQQGSGGGAQATALDQALAELEKIETGRSIVQAIRARGTQVRFGEATEGAIAHFDPRANEIVISETLRDATPSVLSAHLAHEGTHVKWSRSDSIDQEYHAFSAQAEVWNRLKASHTDEQCDWVSWMISLGERDAKNIIRRYYPGLPE
ncbi:MAG: hypothetical protein FJ009_04820 [Chloroflexi bacterium]|nr:hypothetical protein [Chloroflexota bacterium]